MKNNLITCDYKSQIKQLETQVSTLPEGQLLFARNGKYVKWYKSHGSNPIYIPKKDKEYAAALATRNLCERKLILLKEKASIVDQCNQQLKDVEESYALNADDEELLLELIYGQSRKERTSWEKEDYPKNPNYPERLVHKTLAGEFVRSKSEVIIANELFESKIPYRYECALDTGLYPIYPDFTILNRVTRRTLYWEHFGMMDDPLYRKKFVEKLETYSSVGIIPGIDLIMTFETAKHPLDVTKVRNTIEEYFG